MKKPSTHSQDTEHLTPEMAAREIRSGYFTYLLPHIGCITAAIFLGIEHEWVASAGFVTSSLIYIPIALTQYRSDKMICEKALLKYQQWYSQERSAPDSETGP